MKCNARQLGVLGLLSLCALSGNAATHEEAEWPRIGLVLGGGGARGAAHIGVLRELERLRIPVDAIAGTSMGAIVGGLYAAGLSPDDIENLMNSIDWADAFNDDARRENLSFRRKQDDESFLVKFEVGVRSGSLLLPKGIIQGQKLGLILREQTLQVSHIEDFDNLPVPFRAVASDLNSGEARVLRSGDLAMAMRASMSAPGIFAPVTIDGATLVDGGLVANLPVEAVREMDVDIIIAVDVEFPLYEPQELDSALAVTEQMLTILIRRETQRQLDTLSGRDVLIRPAIGDYASTNFADLHQLIGPGEAAAKAVAGQLAPFGVGEYEFYEYQANRQSGLERPGLAEFVRVVDDGPLLSSVLEARIRSTAGQPIDPAVASADAARLFGLALYEDVSYRVVHEDAKVGLEFNTRRKSWGPNYLQFGLALEDDFEGSAGFNVAGRYTRTGLNALGAEWRTDVQLGTEPSLRTEFYQPLSFDSRYFVAPHAQAEKKNINEFLGDQIITRYRVGSGHVGVDLGRELANWGEVRLGVTRGRGSAEVKVGDPALERLEFDTGGLFAKFSYDMLDDAYFPTHGSKFDLIWEMSRPGFGADSDFDTLHSEWTTVKSWGKNTFQLGINLSTTIESDNLIQDYFPLGGFLKLSGLDRGQLLGPHAGLARLVYYRRFGETGGGVFDFPLYLGGSLEAGNVWQDRSQVRFDSLIFNASVFAGLDTFFGPLFLATGFAEGGDASFYLFLGAPPR